MKCSMITTSSRSALFVKVKKIARQRNTIFFENLNQTPLDMCNGLSQVYCIISGERIHQNTKGLIVTITDFYVIQGDVQDQSTGAERF